MRIISFLKNGVAKYGIVRGDALIDVQAASDNMPPDVLSLIKRGPDAIAELARVAKVPPRSASVPIDSVQLLPPIANPGKTICLGLNYADHAAEGGHERPNYPSLFLRASSSFVAHQQSIIRPRCSDKLDFEAELAVVIGQRAKHVAVSNALCYVAGYSCFNDATIRDYQRKTSQWTIGKNFDGTGAFGPALVTPDELPAGATGLRIASRLNGQVMQDSNTSNMLFPVAETITLLSECMTLEPGDVIAMGTPSGVGHARKPPLWMKHGDVIEIEIQQLGVLRNPIEDQA